MKLLRSRIRLVSILVACAFLVTAALCAGTVLRAGGITLPSLPSLGQDILSGPSAGPEDTPDPDPASPAAEPPENTLPGVTLSPDPEYNVFGL